MRCITPIAGRIAATARAGDKLDALAAANPNIKPYPADVLEPDQLKAAVARIERELGTIDLALLGAGMYAPFNIRNMPETGQFTGLFTCTVGGGCC